MQKNLIIYVHGKGGAIMLFAIASIMCSINSLMKKKHTEFHA